MFLATTALPQFWDTGKELLFLGPWCLRYGDKPAWEKLRYRVMASPWDDPDKARESVRRAEAAQEKLLSLLGEYLNRVHGTRHSVRYWRIVLGPWLLGFISSFSDHEMQIRAAYAAHPDLETWRLSPEDYSIPHDTAEHSGWLPMDRFNLQIYSEILEHLGIRAEPRPFAGDRGGMAHPAVRPRWKSAAWNLAAKARAGLARWNVVKTCFSDLYMDRAQAFQLARSSGFKMLPVVKELPAALRFSPDAKYERKDLAGLRGENDFEKLLISALPDHLPTLYLEGYALCRNTVLSDWRRIPDTLVTSVAWFFNEYFKLLAAESLERGGRLIIAQHGGAYGMLDPMHSERHERTIANEYWTWGWEDKSFTGASAALKRMPNPRLSFPAPKAAARARNAEWLLICMSLTRYPYSWYLANMPIWHRFEEYLEDRCGFIASLPEPLRSSMVVRLHTVDLGWDQQKRLADRFPGLRFDLEKESWTRRIDKLQFVVVDHPQTSCLEALALNIPTLLFWNPKLWKFRDGVEPYWDILRKAGILCDSPKDAAGKAAEILKDPRAWWDQPGIQDSRKRFCDRFAYGDPDWARIWCRELGLRDAA